MSTTARDTCRDEAYAAHRREQLQRWALIPFAEKLRWLEESHHMVLALQKSREAQSNQSPEAPQVLAED